MISPALQQALNRAVTFAVSKRHEFVTVEHVLNALLDDAYVVKIITECGADVAEMRQELSDFFASLPVRPEGDKQEIQTTIGFQRVIQRAVFHVQSSGKPDVQPYNVLISIFAERESHAVYFL